MVRCALVRRSADVTGNAGVPVTSAGVRLLSSGGEVTATDGPFTEPTTAVRPDVEYYCQVPLWVGK